MHAPPVQVKHRYTEQVMVMKEMRHASKEAKLSFLKEVRFPCIVNPLDSCSIGADAQDSQPP